MKRLIAIILIMLLLCGCSANPEEEAASIPLADYPASAFDITVNKCPQKVISLSPEVTDIIFALGSDAQLVGISDNCVSEKELARFGSSAIPNIEAIKEVKPDLVFVTDYAHKDDIRVLMDAKIQVAQVKSAEQYVDLSGIYKNVAILMSGEITGIRNATNSFNTIDIKIKKAANNNKAKVKAAVFVNDTTTVEIGSVGTELLNLAGISSFVNGNDNDIINAKPDLIICPIGCADTFSARFGDVKIKEFDPQLLDRRGVKMLDTVEQIIAFLKE